MIKISRSSSVCRLSWFLVQVGECPTAEYHAIHSVEILGDLNEAYVSRRVRFSSNRMECFGIIRLASDSEDVIEKERDRLMLQQKSQSRQPHPFKRDLWCLVRQTTDDNKVQIITDTCKKLAFVESPDKNKKHFFLQKEQGQVPVSLLHIVDSQQELYGEMEFLNDIFTHKFMSEEKDQRVESGGLDDAYLLLQYFEDASNLIYSIVRYRDTIWKQQNRYSNEVAYVTNGKAVSQCAVLRKSYDINELRAVLLNIRETCDKVDYILLHSHLKKSLTDIKDIQRS